MNTFIRSIRISSGTVEGTRPLGAARAALYFLLAGLGIRLAFYHFIPYLQAQGLSPYDAYVVSFTVPMAILFALAFGAAKQEGVPITIRDLAARFRLRRPGWHDLLWVMAAVVFAVVSGFIFAPTRGWILQLFPVLQPPADFPALLNPTLQNEDLPATIAAWLGPQATGNWSLVALALIMFFFNIMGEELFWRGYLLPRQELVHGRRTWLVHGLMWNLFHLPFYPWYLIFGLPITLSVSFVAHKTGNTWTAIALHTILNLSLYGLVIGVVAGAV